MMRPVNRQSLSFDRAVVNEMTQDLRRAEKMAEHLLGLYDEPDDIYLGLQLIREHLSALRHQLSPARAPHTRPRGGRARAWRRRFALALTRDLDVPIRDPGVMDRLIEFARSDRREDFFWLARSHGIPEAELEALWRGTRRRLVKKEEGVLRMRDRRRA